MNDAEPALREAIDLVQKSTEGLGQTRRIGDALTLVVRPQEAVAAVQAFAQANADFFAAVADYNRAQFRLYRALGTRRSASRTRFRNRRVPSIPCRRRREPAPRNPSRFPTFLK